MLLFVGCGVLELLVLLALMSFSDMPSSAASIVKLTNATDKALVTYVFIALLLI